MHIGKNYGFSREGLQLRAARFRRATAELERA